MGMAELVAQLKVDEGSRKNAKGRHVLYKCPADKWTLGYGRNVEERGCSEAEAVDWLESDVRDAMADAASLFPSWLTIDEVRRDVLTNMSYNLGRQRLSGFHYLVAAVEAKDWVKASAEMSDSKWHHDVGARSHRLESEMLTGKRSA